MFLLRKSFTYIFIITVVGSIFAYVIIAKAYNGIVEENTAALNQ